jgi:hypothetical protein
MIQDRFFIFLILLALIGFCPAPANGAVQARTSQEKWVLQQVKAGEGADLKARFGENEEGRRLSARFLEDLLTGSFKMHRRGIRIANAIIAEPIDIENGQISHFVCFFYCIFKEAVNFRYARFERYLLLSGCEFGRETDFHQMEVILNLFCRDTVFKGPVDFGGAYIGGHFAAENARFLNEKEMASFNNMKVGNGASFYKSKFMGPANFNSMKVEHLASFEESTFKGPADFVETYIGGEFHAEKAQFLNEKEKANFNSMKVAQYAFFGETIFKGPVDFYNANIDKDLYLEEAQFLSGEQLGNFKRIIIGNNISCEKAKFYGPVDFNSADIKNNFQANGAQFLNKEKEANFNSMKVGNSVFFKEATFQGPVDFRSANIGSQFQADGAHFLNKEKEANFNSMKVGNSVFFKEAKFQGPINFCSADIKSNFEANGAQFLNKEKEANFNSMKVGNSVFFKEAKFQGPVNFCLTDIKNNFEANGAQFLNKEKEANFNNMKVGKTAIFDGTSFHAPVDLGFASFHGLQCRNVTYPAVILGGMTYQNINFGDWKNLLILLERSPYQAQPYGNLIAFFQMSGYPDRADEVFIAGKRREWRESWSWEFWKWPFNIAKFIFIDIGVGYGHHSGRVFYFSALFVFIGTVIFSRPNVLICEGKSNSAHINLREAFWYSLDTYLPFISLGPSKYYRVDNSANIQWASLIPNRLFSIFPNGSRKWFVKHYFSGTTYFYLHRMAGYILVSIGIAAITGIIK